MIMIKIIIMIITTKMIITTTIVMIITTRIMIMTKLSKYRSSQPYHPQEHHDKDKQLIPERKRKLAPNERDPSVAP